MKIKIKKICKFCGKPIMGDIAGFPVCYDCLEDALSLLAGKYAEERVRTEFTLWKKQQIQFQSAAEFQEADYFEYGRQTKTGGAS